VLSVVGITRPDGPYFVLERNVCALLAARDHVNLFLYEPLSAALDVSLWC
jgi:hypothetical protein